MVSDNGLTWTYHIKSGVKFQDGTPVTSKDVKYAVERTFDRGVLSNGPSYFSNLLGGNAKTYPGPYKDRSKNLMGLTAVDTPDATTIVFHLAHPFSDFDYVADDPADAPRCRRARTPARATRRTSFPPARTSSRATS